ncbi:MAG: glycoside hydrolase 43 family protein [Duncaniella sp.]|nr:glycoside hydrolase 43 family protein [Duncaniella sp.]
MNRFIISLLLLLSFTLRGEQTYTNPIIHADFSDPDLIRVGDDYWMVASSFTAMPGIPVLHSRNLVDWEIVSYVYETLPFGPYDRPSHGQGSWAPSIRYNEGKYYVYFCTPDEGLFVAVATDPRGPWQLSQMVETAKWEDPCPFWDDDGKAYLVRSKHRGGPAIIHRMSQDGLRLLDDGVTVYCDTIANPVLEGPKMMKRDGWYYILAPAGGVADGWQTVLRSRSVYGPYEARRVLQQGDTDINGPHQGGLVDTPDGSEWWFIHFQSKGIHGRIINLQPARFTADGWIEMGADGLPVSSFRRPAGGIDASAPPRTIQTSDEFSDSVMGLQWQWQANPHSEWSSLTARRGWLRLYSQSCVTEEGNIYYSPSLLLQKLPAERFTATALIHPTLTDSLTRVGLTMFGQEYSYIAIQSGRICVVTGRGDKRFPVSLRTIASDVITDGKPIWLRVELLSDDKCQYSYSIDGERFTPLGPSCNVAPGVWVGAKVGLFCLTPSVVPSASYADIDYFRIQPIQ